MNKLLLDRYPEIDAGPRRRGRRSAAEATPEVRWRPAGPETSGPGLDELFRIIWRRKLLLVAPVVVLTVAAWLILNQLTPRYTADTVVMLDPREEQVVNIQQVLTRLTPETQTAESELEVIRSRGLAHRVIEATKLDQVAEFNPAADDPDAASPSDLAGSSWLDAVMSGGVTEIDPTIQAELVQSEVTNRFLDRLEANQIGRSRAIEISFTSQNPLLASQVANKVAELYLTQQREVKAQATAAARDYLEDRLTDLRADVEHAEQAVADFRANQATIQGRDSTLINQQIAETAQQIMQARNDQQTAQAQLDYVEQLIDQNGPDAGFNVLDPTQIVQLSDQMLRLRETEANLTAQLGANSPLITQLHEDVDSARQFTVDTLVASMRNKIELARQQVNALTQNLAQLRSEAVQLGQADVQLHVLEREADASRALFETFLSRYKETEQIGFEQPDAWIVSPASVPTAASYPKKLVPLALVLVVGGLIGIGLIFVAEQLETGFRTPHDVERETGAAALGGLPKLRGESGHNGRPADDLIDNPLSTYAEGLRGLYTSLLIIQQRDDLGQTTLITSSGPGEGKSTLAASLARVVAGTGRRVLVIDCDLRRPQLHSLFDLPIGPGLVDYLEGHATLEQVLVNDPRSGAQLITAGGQPNNPQEILRSAELRELLSKIRSAYDLILIDSPPVLSVADARVLATVADTCVFVAKWRETRRSAVRQGVSLMRDAGIPIAGVVLTQADARNQAGFAYASYYGTKQRA